MGVMSSGGPPDAAIGAGSAPDTVNVGYALTTWGESGGRTARSKPARERGGPRLLQRRRRRSLRSQRELCSASRSWRRNSEYAGCAVAACASSSCRQGAAVVRLSRSKRERSWARGSWGSAAGSGTTVGCARWRMRSTARALKFLFEAARPRLVLEEPLVMPLGGVGHRDRWALIEAKTETDSPRSRRRRNSSSG